MKWILFTLLIAITGCTSKKEDSQEVKYLKEKIASLEEKMGRYESDLKAASSDHGLQIKLEQDKKMNEARLELLRKSLKKAQARDKELE